MLHLTNQFFTLKCGKTVQHVKCVFCVFTVADTILQPHRTLTVFLESSVLTRLTLSWHSTGALHIAPDSATLWAALGSASPSAAVREHSLSRALQLDPRAAGTWAVLGRLYCQAGDRGLAASCLTAARGHEPTCVGAWEGMGALAAQSATGAVARGSVGSANMYHKRLMRQRNLLCRCRHVGTAPLGQGSVHICAGTCRRLSGDMYLFDLHLHLQDTCEYA